MAIRIAKIAMLVAKIIIYISKTMTIFGEYNNDYSNACDIANKNKQCLYQC